MLKYDIVLLFISLIAGAIGMTNVSAIARRVSIVLFALCLVGFLALLGFAYLLGEAFHAGQQAMLLVLPGIALRGAPKQKSVSAAFGGPVGAVGGAVAAITGSALAPQPSVVIGQTLPHLAGAGLWRPWLHRP